MSEIRTYTVQRTGRRPLRFTGERIATADTSRHDDTRWTEGAVYRLPYPDWPDPNETKGYVLAVSDMTRWDGEIDRHDAVVCRELGELAAEIEELPAAVADELLAALGIVEELDAKKEARP